MKLLTLILIILININLSVQNFDSIYFAFIGSTYDDYKILKSETNLSEIDENYFNFSKPSVFIINGWSFRIDNFRNEMILAYLHRNDCNIIFGDWSFVSSNLNYVFVAESIPDVSKSFVKLLYKIIESGYDFSKIHFIGHSLGAHLAGQIGEMFKANNIFISRITGLDPAGPSFNEKNCFQIVANIFRIQSNTGLRKGNARFVDIIHSDAGFTGTFESSGDLDFWPNGGNNQPSCSTCPSANGDEGLSCFFCNHRTSWRYYAESVRSKTQLFTALRCPDGVDKYTKENCIGLETATMGYQASVDSKPGNYYLSTNAAAPFSKIE